MEGESDHEQVDSNHFNHGGCHCPICGRSVLRTGDCRADTYGNVTLDRCGLTDADQ
jgi:hypothetical protein|tara:strand:- start:113 stop:280 length:168 start_codon:yes stop_codon:yes gene_type:complete